MHSAAVFLLTTSIAVQERNNITLESVAKLELCSCNLVKLLGPPEVEETAEGYSTHWTFERPSGRHWVLINHSKRPIVRGQSCVQHDPIVWRLFGESVGDDELQEMVTFLFGTDDFVDQQADKPE